MKLRINNSITTNQLHIAESMGDYFSSIANNIGSANDAMDYNVIFITVASRAAIDQRIGREVNWCLFIKRTTDWTWKIIVQ